MKTLPLVCLLLVTVDTLLKNLVLGMPSPVLFGTDVQFGIQGFLTQSEAALVSIAFLPRLVMILVLLFTIGIAAFRVKDQELSLGAVAMLIGGLGNIVELFIRGAVVDYLYVGQAQQEWFIVGNISDLVAAASCTITVLFTIFYRIKN